MCFSDRSVWAVTEKVHVPQFRSMQNDNYPTIHREFVRNLIRGDKADQIQSVGAEHAKDFKIKNDPGSPR